MAAEYLSPAEDARLLAITVPTLYDWLSQSDYGLLQIAVRVTVDYLQAGPSGQGRIRIAESEVPRLLELMRVKRKRIATRRPPIQQNKFPGITIPLGRPNPTQQWVPVKALPVAAVARIRYSAPFWERQAVQGFIT